MGKRDTRGFTLIELLIVVAIIGIVSAIAIPNLLNAVDKSKQRRTMSDIRALGEAIESYAIDATIYPTSADMTALRNVVVPVYTRVWTPSDGWQHPIVYQPDTTPGRGYTLQSPGKDGVIEGSPTGGATGDLDCDIIFSNGAFVQWPEGRQQ